MIATPLTNLTKKNTQFVWGSKEQAAFEELKEALIKQPVLALYNPESKHELHTDASSNGLAGILFQEEKGKLQPVTYYSRKTTKEEAMYHSYKLEALAVVESTERFRQFLLGKHFIIVTDCEALKTTMKKKEMISRIAR